MGNMKFPRPKDINFPEVRNKINYKFEVCSEKNGKEVNIAKSICPLKSGNILVSYVFGDLKETTVKNCLAIYSVPKLKLVEEYVFESKVDETIYLIDSAIQLKNGNIFTISDKLYIFDGESISKGPKTSSEEEVNNVDCLFQEEKFLDPNDIFQKKTIIKNSRTFLCDFLFEPKEGILLFTFLENKTIYFLDIANLDPKRKAIFEYSEGNGSNKEYYHLDIIYQSEYYPDNLYICANYLKNMMSSPDYDQKSILLVFNLNEFCDKDKKQKQPLSTIKVNESANVYGLCEYDKKYLLLDTIHRGIQIIDMESKQKVAVSNVKFFIEGKSKLYNSLFVESEKKLRNNYSSRFDTLYRNIIRLKDGRVFILKFRYFIADIREEKKEECFIGSPKSVIMGNYLICFHPQASIIVFQLYKD